MDLGLKDKNVLVTGSSGGIGSSIVNVLLENKCIVSGTDITESSSNSDKFFFKKANLESESEVKALFNQLTSERGRIDALICSHGFWYPNYQPLKDLTLERWNKVLASNVTATMLCVKYFFQNLATHPEQDASIVLIGSTAGMYGLPGFTEYVAVKSALIGLTKSFKAEILNYAPQGRVNLIAPGVVNTSMSKDFRANEQVLKKTLQVSALAKVAEPMDIASIAVVLTSKKVSGHVTGENIAISGGLEGRIIHDFEKITL